MVPDDSSASLTVKSKPTESLVGVTVARSMDSAVRYATGVGGRPCCHYSTVPVGRHQLHTGLCIYMYISSSTTLTEH